VSTSAAGLANAVRLALRVQAAARFPHVYVGVALLLALALRFGLPEWIDVALPILLLNEPGTLGIFLVAAHRFYDRNQRADAALLVTPLSEAAFVAAPVLATTVWGTAAGLLIQAVAQGVDTRLALLVVPMALSVALSGLVGWLLAPVVLIYSLPIATVVGVLPPEALVWLPSQWALTAFSELANTTPNLALVFACCAGLAAANALGMTLAVRVMRARVRPAVEVA
jgi:fluoroquinolone transport system permease protein